MIETRLTSMLGIQHPIISSGMMRVSTAEPVASVANAGALGFLTEKMSFERCFGSLKSRSWPAFMKMLESSDVKEGAKAFLEKRDPVWKGE